MNKIIQEDVSNILGESLPWERLRDKTVLVSGANGFIPSYIIETLLALKYVTVLALVRNREKAESKFLHHLSNEKFRIIVQDVSEKIVISEHLDFIIHAASQASPKYYGVDPVGTLKANTIGTYNLLELAKDKNVEKFLFFSSAEVYGVINDNDTEINESYTGNVDITNIRSCYAESKRMGENMCVCYSYQYGFPVNMIRLAHTYGPGVLLDDGRVFGDFVKNIINNENIVLNSDGSAKRSFCYISDMIIALFIVLFCGGEKAAYNISSDKETSILDLATMLIHLVPEKKLQVICSKGALKDGYMKSRSTRASFNTDKIRALGWNQKVSLENGFARMIKSYE